MTFLTFVETREKRVSNVICWRNDHHMTTEFRTEGGPENAAIRPLGGLGAADFRSHRLLRSCIVGFVVIQTEAVRVLVHVASNKPKASLGRSSTRPAENRMQIRMDGFVMVWIPPVCLVQRCRAVRRKDTTQRTRMERLSRNFCDREFCAGIE